MNPDPSPPAVYPQVKPFAPSSKPRPRRAAEEISDRQAEILAWVLFYRRVSSTWPSYREILIALDFASTNSVCLHLRRIARSGLLAYRGTRDFSANLPLIRSSGVLDRVKWVKLVGKENLLFTPPPLEPSTVCLVPGFKK
jgi:hypothetical protein